MRRTKRGTPLILVVSEENMKIKILSFAIALSMFQPLTVAGEYPDIKPLLQKFKCNQYGEFKLRKTDVKWYVISEHDNSKAIMFLCVQNLEPLAVLPDLVLVQAGKGHPWSECPNYVSEHQGTTQNLILKGLVVEMGDITMAGNQYKCKDGKWSDEFFH